MVVDEAPISVGVCLKDVESIVNKMEVKNEVRGMDLRFNSWRSVYIRVVRGYNLLLPSSIVNQIKAQGMLTSGRNRS